LIKTNALQLHQTATWVSRYRNVSILDFIGAKGDGCGGNDWSYKMCKAPVKMSPPTNQHPVFYRPDAGCPSYRPRNSIKALKGNDDEKLMVEKLMTMFGWSSPFTFEGRRPTNQTGPKQRGL